MDITHLYALTLGLVSVLGIAIGVLVFLIKRMVKGIDQRFNILFKRTDDIEAIKTDIDWLKKNG